LYALFLSSFVLRAKSTTPRYDRARPSYPSLSVDHLIKACNLTSESMILDLAAGTGKFTQLLGA
jgi:ubiquinone/menaquinone biosynthesis C-methylase UbiE